jgi:hypothetical protein
MAATQKNGHEIEKALALNHVPWCEEYEKMISGMLYGNDTPNPFFLHRSERLTKTPSATPPSPRS